MPRSLLTAAGVLLAASAAAQEDGLVVSATRTPRPSLEVPASVDRIYGDEIREGRPQVNLSESLGRVPGIVVQNRQNYAQDLQISSRGFGARSTFGVRGIRLIADGIPATMPDGQGQAATFALGSARSIEVLRGPFSTLYGNDAGGVITIETEDPPESPTIEGDGFLGSYRTRRLATKFGARLGAVGGIADLSRFETAGYRDHSAAQRDHANAKLRYAASADSDFTLVGNSIRQIDTQDPLGLTRAQFDQDPRQAGTSALQFNTKKSITQDQGGATLNQRLGGGTRAQVSLYGGHRSVEQLLAIPTAAQAAATHSGGIVSLDRNYGGGAIRFFQDSTLLGAPLQASVGLEQEYQVERRRGYLNNNGVSGALKRDEDDTVESTGAYAQAEWKLTPRWIVNGGLRASRVRFVSADHFAVAGTANGDDSGSKAYSATTPVAGLVFRATPLTSLYASYGRGFETPTFAELANRTAASGVNFGLQASRSRHFELGAKSVLPGWLRVNAALFNIVTENEIVVDQNTGGRASFKNVGHTDRNGFELGAESLLPGPFEARIAYTYLKAAFREGFNTVLSTVNTPVAVPGGSALPGVPKEVLYGELRYRAEPFYAQLEGTHKSRVPVNDPNSEFADAYTVFNVMAGLVQHGGGWRITEFARIDNVTDRNYVGSVIVNETNGRFYEPSPRRSISIGLRASLQF
ncbi:MAG TPA: TonB-dependent receptor [Burkholderiales bacterium]|jgi:iron complex outermembrane receptor protein|nr:TonB-dependent receptor [Burkholderiales bacterium]